MKHFQPVFDHWDGSATAMAADLGQLRITCQKWIDRDSVPAFHWPAIIERTGLTLEQLAGFQQARDAERPVRMRAPAVAA